MGGGDCLVLRLLVFRKELDRHFQDMQTTWRRPGDTYHEGSCFQPRVIRNSKALGEIRILEVFKLLLKL